MSDLLPTSIEALERIRTILAQARAQALQAVNSEMVRAYWKIGQVIVEEEQRGAERAEYGARLIQSLAERLSQEFGKGFNERNLRFMREFYQAFPNWNAVRSELSWTHYRIISRIDKPEARSFYLEEAIRSRWSTRELERQVNSLLFERLARSRDKEGVLALANQGAEVHRPADLVRDPYVLEFTGLPERGQWQESDLEQALMDRLTQFLLELGRDFFFVARQKRISVDAEHNYIDLVFYHRTLRCFVLIDLKAGFYHIHPISQRYKGMGLTAKRRRLRRTGTPSTCRKPSRRLRKAARVWAALRVRQASSPRATSRLWCSRFSMSQ